MKKSVMISAGAGIGILILGYVLNAIALASGVAACCGAYATLGILGGGSSNESPSDSGGGNGETKVILCAEGGPLDGEEFVIYEDGASCGRHTSNTIVIPEAAVSRQHFKVQYRPELGHFFVVDRGSTTGRSI